MCMKIYSHFHNPTSSGITCLQLSHVLNSSLELNSSIAAFNWVPISVNTNVTRCISWSHLSQNQTICSSTPSPRCSSITIPIVSATRCGECGTLEGSIKTSPSFTVTTSLLPSSLIISTKQSPLI